MPMLVQNMWWAIEGQNADDATRTYHTRLKLMDNLNICRAATNMTQAMLADGTLLGLPPVLRLVLDIRGVAEAVITAYALTIVKSPVVSWAEIEAEVTTLLYGVRQAVTLQMYDINTLEASAE
jgi:hypothetical protein